MSATGLSVFDRTLHSTNSWLNDIADELGQDEPAAWRALSVVLQKLRDRLPVELAAKLSAELPLLIRGVFYDKFEPASQPTTWTLDDLVDEVQQALCSTRWIDAQDALRSVLVVLSERIPAGQIAKVQAALPADIRGFWLSAAARSARVS